MAKLIGIAIKREHRGQMEILECAEVTMSGGIVGDYRGAKAGKRQRQVTVLSQESWQDACGGLGKKIDWEARRANLLIQGMRFGQEDIRKKLRIGPDVILEITGETAPCGRMNEAVPGLMNALKPNWRGGITCKVLCGGSIKNGDNVTFE